MAISAEHTEHVLYRLLNGNIEGIKPKAAMILIGTNNLGHEPHEQPEWAAAGVKKVVDTVRAKSPGTKILLLALFPRGAEKKGSDGIFKNTKPNGSILEGQFEPLTKAFVEVIQRENPKAKIIWASTTPISFKDRPAELDPESNPIIIENNRMAATMKSISYHVRRFSMKRLPVTLTIIALLASLTCIAFPAAADELVLRYDQPASRWEQECGRSFVTEWIDRRTCKPSDVPKHNPILDVNGGDSSGAQHAQEFRYQKTHLLKERTIAGIMPEVIEAWGVFILISERDRGADEIDGVFRHWCEAY